MIGSWIQQVALGWLVYRLTDSAFYLGLLGGIGTLPSFFIAPIAGVLADTFDRRRIVMLMQILTVVQAVVLALLVWTGAVTVAELLILSVFTGMIQGVDWPTRQSLLVHLVSERADLGNAIALNSTVFNLARIVGPTLAGTILAAGGDRLCFFLNAAACGLALVFINQVRTPKVRAAPLKIHFRRELAEGAVYIWRDSVIRRGIVLVVLASSCIMPYVALLPLFAADVFGGAAQLFAALAAAPAVGAVAGGLWLASRRNQKGLPQRILIVGVLASLSLILFGLSRSLPLSIAALTVLGGMMMVWMSSINTQLQTAIREEKRGRVMSFFTMALMGAMPIGYFIFGTLAERVGVATTVILGGIVALTGNLWLHREALTRQALLLRRRLA